MVCDGIYMVYRGQHGDIHLFVGRVGGDMCNGW